MVRFLTLSMAAVAVQLSVLGSIAQADDDFPAQVIARITLRAPENKEKPIFAEKGDLMTIIETKDNAVMVHTSEGRKGWVRKQDVVALKDSVPIFDELIRADPKDSWLLVTRAMAHGARGDKEQEIADYTRAIDIKNDTPTVYINRGVAYATSGETDKAIDDYSQAIKLGFKDGTVYTNRGVAYLSKGEAEKAIADFSEVLENDEADVFVRYQRALAYQRLQKWDEAIADFTKVVELEPENLQAISSRGFSHFLKGEPKPAIEDFTRVIELNPKSGLAYNNRGYNRQMIGDFAGALADYEKSIELTPDYPLPYQNKAWLLATCPDDSIRDGKQAIEAAQKAGTMRKWEVPADVKSLAAAYAESGDFDKAVEWQKKAVAIMEGDAKSGEEELLKLYEAKAPFRFAPPENDP